MDSNSEFPPIETLKIYDEKDADRLRDLPDNVLLHILSFMHPKDAVQTCILSKRWINLWKYLTALLLYSSYFATPDGFTEFATQILSHRDDSTPLYSLVFATIVKVQPDLLEKILKYAVSHDVQRLKVILSHSSIEQIPSCIFSCDTLTTLNLAVGCYNMMLFPNSLNLPALTELSLVRFVFCSNDDGRAEPFSALKKLNSLAIWFCKVLDAQNLCISSVTLANLTIQTSDEWNYRKIELSTPSLSTFAYAGTLLEKLGGSHLSSVEHVNIDAYMCSYNTKPPSNLLSWLSELTGIKSLTVTSTTLLVLALVPNLSKVELQGLCNLKSLRINMKGVSSRSSKKLVDGKFMKLFDKCLEEVEEFGEAIFREGSPTNPNGIVGFLLQNSPSAKVHIDY